MSWFLAFLGFALLILLHEAGHFAAAKAVGMRVEKFSLFFGPFLWSRRKGETEYGIGPIPLGGYVKITGMNPTEEIPPEVAHRAYYRQPVWKRIVVIFAGPLVNFVLAFLILWGLFATTPVVEGSRPVVESVGPGTPGEQANGCVAATPAELTVVRDGRERQIEVAPVYDEVTQRPLIGFSFEVDERQLGIGESANESVATMWEVTSRTVETIVGLVYSAEKRDEVGSVVGGYEATRRAIEFDVARAVFILGLISLSLAVINLFPFLPLDGGHIFWALAEKVRGRAIPFATMEKASVVGFMLVIVLFFIGVTNDIERLRDGTFDRLR
jgi:regulator of sigma E protease